MSDHTNQLGRIRWKCRRGMLELDLLFAEFVDRHYDHLSAQQKMLFEKLLDQEDQDLQRWLFAQAEPEDIELKMMVELILTSTSNS